MADLQSSADQGRFLAKSVPDTSNTRTEEATSRECEARRALLQFCSFPEVGCHPRKAAIEAQSRAWLTNLYHGRLPAARIERLLDTRLDVLCSTFYPNGFSDARSFTLSKLGHWIFLFDDVVDDPHLLGHNYEAACQYVCRLFKAMFNGDMMAMVAVGLTSDDVDDSDDNQPQQQMTACNAIAKHVNLSAICTAKEQQDLVMEMGMQWANEMRDLGMSPRQLERLRGAVAEYMVGVVGLVKCRQEKRLPSLKEYTQLRRMDFAMHLYLLGCEFDLGIDLSDETLEHPLVKELHETTTDQMMWINDLLSFKREFHNEDLISLLPVLHYCKRDKHVPASNHLQVDIKKVSTTNFEEAICEAHAMIGAVDKQRMQVVAEIAAWKSELQPYVEATHLALSGLTYWTLWSPRYQRMDPI